MMMMFRFLLGLLLVLWCVLIVMLHKIWTKCITYNTLATRSLFAYLNCLVTKQLQLWQLCLL